MFWESVFNGSLPQPADAARWSREVGHSEPVGAAWLLERILDPDVPTGRDRLGAVSFAQRLFPCASASQLADVAHVARGFIEWRTAIVSVERLGASDVGLFRAAQERARELSRPGEDAATASSLAQFQAALVILERLHARRVLSPDAILDLLSTLLAVRPREDGRYGGAVARWFDTALVPALGVRLEPGAFG